MDKASVFNKKISPGLCLMVMNPLSHSLNASREICSWPQSFFLAVKQIGFPHILPDISANLVDIPNTL